MSKPFHESITRPLPGVEIRVAVGQLDGDTPYDIHVTTKIGSLEFKALDKNLTLDEVKETIAAVSNFAKK